MSQRSPKESGSSKRKKRAPRSNLFMGIFIVVVVGILVVVGLTANPKSPSTTTKLDLSLIGKTVPTSIERTLASFKPAVYSGQGWTAPTATKGAPVTVAGKTAVLFMGAEFCPYCAAERWPLIIALSRFGTFNGLKYMASSGTDTYPDTPTFSFYKASYSSPYVVLQSVEMAGRTAVGGQYPPLQQPTPGEAAFFNQQNSSGGIPLMSVGYHFLWLGAPYEPNLLKGETWTTILQKLKDPAKNSTEQDILQNANIITASICSVDGMKPASVCQAPAIKSLYSSLPTQ